MVSTCPANGNTKSSDTTASNDDGLDNNGNRHRSNSNNSNRNKNNSYRNRNRNYGYDDNVLSERNTEQSFVDNNHLNDDGDSAVIIDSDDNASIDGVARSKVSRSSSISSSSILKSTRTSLILFGHFVVIFISFICFEQQYV